MKLPILAKAFAVISIGACIAMATAQITPTVEGQWFGSSNSPNEAHCWISNRKSDGTYRTDFITQDGSVYKKYWQEGTWSVANGILSTVVKSESGTTVPARKLDYAIVNLTAEQLVYRHVSSQTRFAVQRVAPDFLLPEKCAKTDA